MPIARVAWIFVTLAAVAACSLFSDLGGFSGDGAAPTADSGVLLDASVDDGSSSPPDASLVIDAGPDASAYKQAVLADGPIAYWPFDDGAGASFARETIASQNGDVIGTLTFGVPGVDGTAVERSDTGGELDVGDHFDLAGQQAYSIELWAWPKGDGQFENILHKRDENGKGWIIYFREASANIQIEQTYAAGQRTTYAAIPMAKTKFHHFVFVFDPADPVESRSRVYIDNVRTNGFSDDGPADDVTKSLEMMQFVGILDEVAIYDHALKAERISEHYLRGSK
jgi:hypothetical protein